MTATYAVCRYLGRRDNQCTAEALDPYGPILICGKHAARVMQMVSERTTAVCDVSKDVSVNIVTHGLPLGEGASRRREAFGPTNQVGAT